MAVGTLALASASRTVFTGRGDAGRLRAASCCSIDASSVFAFVRTSIFPVPVRSIDEMAVVTVACVAKQLKTTPNARRRQAPMPDRARVVSIVRGRRQVAHLGQVRA